MSASKIIYAISKNRQNMLEKFIVIVLKDVTAVTEIIRDRDDNIREVLDTWFTVGKLEGTFDTREQALAHVRAILPLCPDGVEIRPIFLPTPNNTNE